MFVKKIHLFAGRVKFSEDIVLVVAQNNAFPQECNQLRLAIAML